MSIGLPVETITNSDTLDTSSITKDLSKLLVTPVSPNRGKVVFKSYRLRHRATNNDNETSDRLKDMNTVSKPNSENDIQLANIPSGNSTRPPPPDKYKSGNSRSIRCITIHVCIAISTSNRYITSTTTTGRTIRRSRAMSASNCMIHQILLLDIPTHTSVAMTSATIVQNLFTLKVNWTHIKTNILTTVSNARNAIEVSYEILTSTLIWTHMGRNGSVPSKGATKNVPIGATLALT